jgi:hypothetical protein
MADHPVVENSRFCQCGPLKISVRELRVRNQEAVAVVDGQPVVAAADRILGARGKA